MNAITNKMLNAVEDRDCKVLKAILDSPSAWSRFDADDYLVLHHLCQIRWSEGLKLALTDTNAMDRLNRFDSFSWTPLIQAVKAGDVKSVETLLNYGADANAHEKARIGNTALIEAVGLGDMEIVDVLLLHGADPMITGWMGLNALQKAQSQFEKSRNLTAKKILESLERHLGKRKNSGQ